MALASMSVVLLLLTGSVNNLSSTGARDLYHLWIRLSVHVFFYFTALVHNILNVGYFLDMNGKASGRELPLTVDATNTSVPPLSLRDFILGARITLILPSIPCFPPSHLYTSLPLPYTCHHTSHLNSTFIPSCSWNLRLFTPHNSLRVWLPADVHRYS